MLLTRPVRIQLVIFSVITIVALGVMGVVYMRIPERIGLGTKTIYVDLPDTGGIYGTANVTYRGVTIGRVDKLTLDPHGVVATLTLTTDDAIPADVSAEVHSQSAIGEQYIDLVPNSSSGPTLADGDRIGVGRVTVPQQIGPMIDKVNSSLQSLNPDALRAVINEASEAFTGTGPALRTIIGGANRLTSDTRRNLDVLTRLVDNAVPVLASQQDSAESLPIWIGHAADLTDQVAQQRIPFANILSHGDAAANQAAALFTQIKPTLPIMLGNLVTQSQILALYNAALEQILVLIPQGISALQSVTVMDRNTTGAGTFAFNLNLNDPEPCTVGFLPAEQRRGGEFTNKPERPDRPLYCAIPQSDQNAVRGARNLPCFDNPGKRAPSVEICKSDQPYQPQGRAPWIGPAQPASMQSDAPQVSVSTYNATTGEYVAPSGQAFVIRRPGASPIAASLLAPTLAPS